MPRQIQSMPFLYILENQVGKHYVGITQLEPNKRLERHNKGDVISTKSERPWILRYTEPCESMIDARKKEKSIKKWHGGNAFKAFLAKAGRSSNGRTAAFEAVNLGSIPSLPALVRSAQKKIWRGEVGQQ